MFALNFHPLNVIDSHVAFPILNNNQKVTEDRKHELWAGPKVGCYCQGGQRPLWLHRILHQPNRLQLGNMKKNYWPFMSQSCNLINI